MNDYRLGNFICAQRKRLGLSQTELAKRLGVTNKAVSKWENGRSMPTTQTLRRLAACFGITVEQLLAAWTGHPHLRVIDNSVDFETKLKRVIAEIAAYLGEPEPLEIERKFLIAYPDIAWLESYPTCQRVEIIQTYLTCKEGEEVRVRQRGADGSYIYCMTTKRKVDDVKRVEVERRLSKDEYLNALMDADPNKRAVRKTRYCLTYENQYFEIDVYPFWDDRAIVEIELSDENAEIVFPPQLQIIKEVTADESYKNASLAKI